MSMVTIEDRRVTTIPDKLESKLHLEPYCFACHKSGGSISKCSSCKLAFYCSRECQQQDWSRHKKEDECVKVKKLYLALDKAKAKIVATHGSFEAMVGRFSSDGVTKEYMSARIELSGYLGGAAGRHPIMGLRESELADLVEIKRLTHKFFPDFVDISIAMSLLGLHRDDDAISFIRYWLGWRNRLNIHDDLILKSLPGEWPFPCEKDGRFLDIMNDIKSFGIPVRHYDLMPFPTAFIMVVLMVKIRNITVHEGEILKEQTRQAKEVMDHIDGLNPSILSALLNPDPFISQPIPEWVGTAGVRWIVDYFPKDEPGTFGTLKAMLLERFGSEKPS